ncbi:hypothetical protein [Notoacmeibacter sp. MSK16QG-6]|uniref:hypothetical protein n=1 Tax=Notoacmeibacter sp. MSK16QG-6 TaxID=2957982 RepID=UPI0020A0A1ED|nr:hypothetical protein [Notoacmeibacter sp. MSK16QG-6]MCP1200078.1 hypothetical protein [Notoacmeibacter sp. MSK16QG-6]
MSDRETIEAEIKAFIEAAQDVSVEQAAERMGARGGLRRAGGSELVGPCLFCGGEDAFSINTAKNAWNCRKVGYGGRDGISLAAHIEGLPQNLDRREDFLAACGAALGEAVPDGAEESEEDRAARQKKRAAAQQKAQRDAKKREADSNRYREASRNRARERLEARRKVFDGFGFLQYLALRLGCAPDDLIAMDVLPPFAGTIPDEPYFHTRKNRKVAEKLGAWAAMALPVIDAGGATIGAHITWMDETGQKGRPSIPNPDKPHETLPTKKMMGSHKGALIPLLGFVSGPDGTIAPRAGCDRLVTGEGIENTLALALAEAGTALFARTLYAAAATLGNLTGKADPKSGFSHPTLKTPKGRPQRIAGPVPHPDFLHEAMPLPAGVTDVVQAGDGDSEAAMTLSAMMRGETRWRLLGAQSACTLWPQMPDGQGGFPGCGFDWCDVIGGAVAPATEEKETV